MRTAGIISEYNPFHRGHAWQIGELRRRLGAETAVVCAMSGSFVQRGDFAVMRTHARAEAAVRGGADLVLELPLPWAIASAEGFAAGGVGVLAATVAVDTLVMHTQTSAWICYDNAKNEGLGGYNLALLNIMDELDRKHIPFHLGDELLMERHGRVEGDTLVIGEMRYRKVILPPHIAFLENTERLLREFRENGGQYTHGAIWLALALLSRGRRAEGLEVLLALLPKESPEYGAEPYVLAADVYTNPERYGQAGWSWYTGSAGWYLRAVLEGLFGLRMESGRLSLPELPEGWELSIDTEI